MNAADIKWDSRDKAYWKEVFKKAKDEGFEGAYGQGAVKAIRDVRITHRMPKPKPHNIIAVA